MKIAEDILEKNSCFANIASMPQRPSIRIMESQMKTHSEDSTTCDILPREICDNLPQRHFLICNRIIAAMFEILILLSSPRVR